MAINRIQDRKVIKPAMLIDLHSNQRMSAIARDYVDGEHVESHLHREAQLLYAATGLMRLVTANGAWVIPPTRGVWIPPQLDHEIFMAGTVQMRTLFISPEACPTTLTGCCVLGIPPLLRELILRAVHLDDGKLANVPEHPQFSLLEQLILLELTHLQQMPLHLPMPRDRRLQAICVALLQNPEHGHSLEDWAQQVGASSRTLTRLFTQELGMSFQQWRQQLRLTEALPRLLAGDSVQSVAHALGYGSTRAFSAMFSRLLGETPRDYVKNIS